MMEHVIKNEIINKHQFGFQKSKSSNDTVIILTETITELLEKGETVMSIFLDLAKAFNSISHELFLLKITKYGFGKDSIEMLKSFLSNRKQCVKKWNNLFRLDRNKSRSPPRYSFGTISFYTVC